jgi:anti-sigma-K factor RskA
MINERMEEQAGLYVLGALPDGEIAAFEEAMKGDAELRNLVESLRISRDAMAGALPCVEPPAALKQKIMARIESQKIVKLPPAPEPHAQGWAVWLPWALAACLAVVCAVSFSRQNAMREKLGLQEKQIADLNKLADSLRAEAGDLRLAVARLNETNRLENLRIAMLGSLLEDSPKAVAVSLWDNSRQSGVFVVQNLKPLPADKDYQLWVIDPKYSTPVSAGVFQVDDQGNMRIQFKTDKLIESANKFAVTQEPKGGLPVPTLKNMVLIGG